MAAIDREAIQERRIPGLLLMEHAGLKVCRVLEQEVPDWRDQKFLVVAGTGNNGGDGFVIARDLARAGAIVGVELVRGDEKIRGDARTNLDALEAYDIEVFHAKPGNRLKTLLADATVIIDCMLGTGFRGELAPDILRAVKCINAAVALDPRKTVIAVDVPTGLDATAGRVLSEAVKADFTVTMGLPKVGFFLYPAPDYLGKLHVAEIGFPPTLLQDPEIRSELRLGFELSGLVPRRRADAHKGNHGRVLIIGGSRGMVGAAVLSARAALRAGAGLVRLVVPDSQQIPAASLAPEVMVTAAPDSPEGTFSAESAQDLLELAEWADTVLIGPGLGRRPEVTSLVRELVGAIRKPLVLDADALHALEPRKGLPDGDFIATPHAGELSHLLATTTEEIRRSRIERVLEAARLSGATVVLKGAYSLVACPDGKYSINPTGSPGLATAGTGDVLAGMIAAFRASAGLQSYQALQLACYLHGLAGDLAEESRGTLSMIAPDLLEELPRAFRILQDARGPTDYDKVRLI